MATIEAERDTGQRIARPVVVIVVLHLLAAIAFGLMALVAPGNQFPDLVAGGELVSSDAGFAVSLYGNRNLGVGLALVAALVLRSRMMLVGLFVVRFITDVGDLIYAMANAQDGAGAVVGSLVFFAVLFASELYVIRTLLRSGE